MGIIEEVDDWGVGAEAKLLGDSPTNWREGVEAEGDSDASKSQDTPCLVQFPHTGCTSSHCTPVKTKKSYYGKAITLIFLFLHRWQPALDFLCDLLGGIAPWTTGEIKGQVVPVFAKVYTWSYSKHKRKQ